MTSRFVIRERSRIRKELIEAEYLITRFIPYAIKDIEGADGYSVTANGLIWSQAKGTYHPAGIIGMWMRQADHDRGYKTVVLRVNGKSKTHLCHRLVAEAFIPNPEKHEQVNHKNCIKHHNIASNLEWVSNLENMQHARRNIKFSVTEKLKSASRRTGIACRKLSDQQVRDAREMRAEGKTHREIAEKFGVSQGLIQLLLAGRSYKEIV